VAPSWSRTEPQRLIRGFVRACHFPPTVAVTLVVAGYGWSLGWRATPLLGVAIAVFLSQLSVGWSNDAFDSDVDAMVGRTEKPTVAGEVSVRGLWVGAVTALIGALGLGFSVAGGVGGSFLALAILAAWLYNVALSRTRWSWLPYAIAFGAIPPFLTYGLDGRAPAPWAVAVFALIGVSAHLANGLPDLESDQSVGLGGAVVRLGTLRATALSWLLLAIGSALLILEAARTSLALAAAVVLGYLLAVGFATIARGRQAMFQAILLAVGVDAAAVALLSH
jgi:4-hydroxybenzoate polyprenyltransferase